MARRRQRLGPGGGDLDGHRREIRRQPVDAAVFRRVGEAEGVEQLGTGVAEAREVVEGDGLTAQVGAHDADVRLEIADGCGREAEVCQGRVAPADAERRPSTGRYVHAGDAGGGSRGVARRRVGDAGAELEVRCRRRGKRESDVGVARQVLRVDYHHAVEARGFGALGLAPRHLRVRYPRRPEFSHPRNARSRRRGASCVRSTRRRRRPGRRRPRGWPATRRGCRTSLLRPAR